VEYVKSLGCQVEAITFGRSASSGLKGVVDDFIDLDEDPKSFLIGHRGNGRNQKGKLSLKKQIQKVVGTDTDDI
jgi:hypothetical protein